MEKHIRWVTTILAILTITSQTGDALKCYKCLAMNTSEEIGDAEVHREIRSHVVEVLNNYYYIDDESDVKTCPPPTAIEEWENGQSSSSWNRPCGYLTRSESSCALGRFRVITSNHEGKKFVLHGTILGCAKRRLRNEAMVEVTYKSRIKQDSNYYGTGNNDKAVIKETTSTLHTCALSLYPGEDPFRGLVHEMELEHCAPNICYTDFCSKPEESEVRIFIDTNTGLDIPWTWIILAALVLGGLVALFSMLGLKYS